MRTPPPSVSPSDGAGRLIFSSGFSGRSPWGRPAEWSSCFFIVLAIFADVLAPYPYWEAHPADRMQGASARYLLGTDQLGRDFLSRLIVGARISMLVGLAATALNVVVAVLIGGISGFIGGKFDLVMQRLVDAWMAFPGLLILLTIMSIVGRGLPQIIVVLGIAGGIAASRIVRSAVIGVKENDYFLAARAVGTPTSLILLRHVLPNIMAPVIIIFSINIGGVIISEASLSFLGFGLPGPDTQLGRDAQPGRAQVHGAGALAGTLARALPDDYRLLLQHVRGCHARSARPPATGRTGKLRRCRETQTKPPGPTDQSFQILKNFCWFFFFDHI